MPEAREHQAEGTTRQETTQHPHTRVGAERCRALGTWRAGGQRPGHSNPAEPSCPRPVPAASLAGTPGAPVDEDASRLEKLPGEAAWGGGGRAQALATRLGDSHLPRWEEQLFPVWFSAGGMPASTVLHTGESAAAG